jgi:hypothetical protein
MSVVVIGVRDLHENNQEVVLAAVSSRRNLIRSPGPIRPGAAPQV